MADAGRVIAGAAKGVRLLSPPAVTRPLTDRVKQSLFGALVAEGAVGEGTAFLDLFAGSGAAGIEALSLGARLATFVEQDRRACEVIAANLRRTGLPGGVVIGAEVLRFLAAGDGRRGDVPGGGRGGGGRGGGPCDAALLDPPYDEPLLVPALELLGTAGAGWLDAGATVVAKHFWRAEMPAVAGQLARQRQKRFGETTLTFYRYQP